MISRRGFVTGGAAACLLGGLRARAAETAPSADGGGLPGVDLSGMTADQRALLASWAKDAFCYCGCPHGVAQCLRQHGACRHSKRMTALAARLVRAGAKRPDLDRMIDAYYASFDKRARLDVAKFGPPLGNPDAPITIVEFSDFKCPFCQAVRPKLEAFVRTRSERVKLYYKPFPIESHPGAPECAQAGEWARDQGKFWAMHDAIFENPGALSVEDLADLARGLGLQPAELREAIAAKRYLPKIRDSQAEARAAGLKGTPTLYLDGRILTLTDYSDEGLDHTLEDEEEWRTHRGWIRD